MRRIDETTWPLSWPLRWTALAAGGLVLGLLITARQLAPNDAGLGTHQQLGLPPCSSIVLFGVTCPSCGMTTSWAHLTRGQIGLASQANLGGLLLAVIALAYIPASCYFFVKGRSSRRGWFSLALAIALATALLAAVVQWCLRSELN